MNKILDNLNKYIKSDLHDLLFENIKHIDQIYETRLRPTDHFSRWNSISVNFYLRFSKENIFCYIDYNREFNTYYLEIKNRNYYLNKKDVKVINLKFANITSCEEVFRIINEFSEEYLKEINND